MDRRNEISRVLIREGARDNALQMFMPLFQKRGIEISISQLKQFLLRKFVNEASMNNLSLSSNFYLLGVARYYFEGKLTTNKDLNALNPDVQDVFDKEVCKRLNALIVVLRNAYIDTIGTQFEQPEDFGNLTLERLLRKYNKKINKELGVGKEDEGKGPTVSDDYSAGKNYTYEILYSYNDARKYKEATDPGAWCITYGEQHYNGYIRNLDIHYVIFRQNGFENVPRKVGPGFTKQKPHDAYGNSLIAVLQSNRSPEPIYITSRWNHGYYGDGTYDTEADHAYTTDEFLKVIGADYSVLERAYEQWNILSTNGRRKAPADANKFKTDSLRAVKYAQMLINGGKNPRDIEWLKLVPLLPDPNDEKTREAYLVLVDIDGGGGSHYYTIMDRRKLFIDKLFVKSGRADYVLKDNGLCLLVFTSSKFPYVVYDAKKHRLFDIDGEYMFKQVSSLFHNNSLRNDIKKPKYAFFAMSGNQVAMVKHDTMEPIRARNGSAWFEEINWCQSYRDTNFESAYSHRGVVLPFDNGSGIVRMTYDSSAEERYYYNTITDAFVDFGVENRMIYNITDADYGEVTSLYRVTVHSKNSRGSRFIYKLYDSTCDKYLSFDGNDTFSRIEVQKDNNGFVAAYKAIGRDYYMVYHIDKGAHFTVNGQPLVLYDHMLDLKLTYGGWMLAFSLGHINGYSVSRYIPLNPYNLKAATVNGELLVGKRYECVYNNRSHMVKMYLEDDREVILEPACVYAEKDNDIMRNESRKFNEVYRRITGRLIEG